ncbi:alpha/beta hydrolase [Heyndrickxia acidiproducens]|uniref:alpha/beta hydrolase n=1 Tax=Heyndrickxia acidiproducens TaxID=1121084 RepID=UPI00036C58BF|nr:alpha/beta fold hydrolase [Heyndrickxia acidiproducens]
MYEQFPVIPGASSFFFKGNDIGILISHGFNGTPQSVRFLGEYLASKGFSVHAPRLSGHGTHYRDMERCTCKDWINSLEEGYRFLKQHCREIFVIGQSMGGTLTLNLAEKYTDIRGIVLINAAINSIPVLEKCLLEQQLGLIDEADPDIKAPGAKEITYDKVPASSIRELLAVMQETHQKLSRINCPALLFQSIEDHVVPPENTNEIAAGIRSTFKPIIPLRNSYHVASLDQEKEQIAEQCSLFIQKVMHKNTITAIE